MPKTTDAFIAELEHWVRIETPTADAAAVDRLGDRVVKLAESMGLTVERLPAAPGLGRTILARGGPPVAGPGLLVLAHLDTVHPAGTLAQRFAFRRDGDRLFGPGIYDMKGSALMALHAWRRLRETGRAPQVPVTFLFSPDEEIGSPSSRSVIENEARRAFACLVVEPARDGGKIVTGRRGVGRFTVTTQGIPAHSGANFENGRSAIREMARQIHVLDGLTDIAAGITVNVGTIRGGSTANTVPAECVIEVDVRLLHNNQADPLVAAIRALTPVDPDIVLSIDGGINRPPFFPDAKSDALFARARMLAAPIGIDLVGVHAGAASDGNFTSAVGTPTLDGLGLDGAGAHTLEEYVLVSSIVPRIELFASLLTDILPGHIV